VREWGAPEKTGAYREDGYPPWSETITLAYWEHSEHYAFVAFCHPDHDTPLVLEAGIKYKEGAQMLRGLTTVSFWAADLLAAKKWYSELLGIEPYFERPDSEHPAYIEFRLGDYQHELGIIDSKYAPKGAPAGPGGAVIYWHVDDVAAALEKVIAMGAKEYEPLTNREAGFITASVVDPFGNILGLMYNPHYLEVLGATKKA
jgi:predicted enzyme related to lactoylglutathione lyase